MDEKPGIDLKILKALFNITNSIGSELELEKVCDLVVEKIYQLVNCNGCAIILINRDRVKLQSEIGFGESIDDVEFSTEMPLIKYILSTKNKIFIGDIEKSYFKYSIPRGDLTTSMICMPILVKDRVRGIIYIDSKHINAFSNKHEYFLNILAHEISVAIERAIVFEKIKELTIRDELTGVYNRRKFDQDLKDELNKAIRYVRNLSLLMIDIDFFKKFNDRYGHQTGDIILNALGALFSDNMRNTDKAYRYGGEEFAIICTETNRDNAIIFAERLRKAISEADFTNDAGESLDGGLTVSIGVANFPANATKFDGLIKHADNALYKAKADGRNKVIA
jgi:diguanylate cyclase (GGDEF)-like protein